MINDVLQACHKLNVKAIKALDFIDKWAAYLKRNMPHTEEHYFHSMQDCGSKDQYEIIRFSKEVKRKPSKKESHHESTQKPCK